MTGKKIRKDLGSKEACQAYGVFLGSLDIRREEGGRSRRAPETGLRSVFPDLRATRVFPTGDSTCERQREGHGRRGGRAEAGAD